MLEWKSSDLDKFVEESDRLGGPGSANCQIFWNNFSVVLVHKVNQDLDPFGEDYVAEQMKVYRELANRDYNSVFNEKTDFNLAAHVAAPNPYGHVDPAGLALHIQRLSRTFRLSRAKRGELLLDLGCGWGLSSELAAYLGLRVEAIDINPMFVQLVNERAMRSASKIHAVNSTFETFVGSEPADLALFYECLHHAVRPWVVIDRVAATLKTGGRLLLSGEPINHFWWRNWGMRLDAISVYCMRKFGWFESGWSMPFITEVLFRSGLLPEVSHDPDDDVGPTIVATKGIGQLSGQRLVDAFRGVGCVVEGDYVIIAGAAAFTIRFPGAAARLVLHLQNFRGGPVGVRIDVEDAELLSCDMPTGPMNVTVPRKSDIVNIRFCVERWVPDEELGNGDKRTIGIHMSGITFEDGI